MHFAHLGAVAALTAGASSFLIPSTMSSPNTKEVYALPFETESLARERVVEVSCPGCPVATTGEGLMSWGNSHSILRLNFTVDRDYTDRLMVNNLQIYPFSTNSIAALTADQLIKSPDDTWAYSSTQPLGYGVKMRQTTKEGEAENEISLLTFDLEVIEVGNQWIRGIPSVSVMVVNKNGHLMIADAHTERAQPLMTGGLLQSSDKDCTSLLCRWKAIVAAKTAALRKGCGKSKGKGFAHKFPGIKGGPNKFPHHSGPHGKLHGHHHQRHGTLARLFRSFTMHILVPVLIGIVVGITASLVGMIVGQFIVLVWRVLFRRSQRGQYGRVEQDEAEDTKVLIIEDQPPVYEDAVMIVEEKTEQK